MKTGFWLVLIVLMGAPLAGCLEQTSSSEECAVLPAGHADDGVLRILTYDITALSDALTDEFTNNTGIELSLIHI